MQPSSRSLRDASAPNEAPTAVHPTEVVHPVTEPKPLAPALAAGDLCANCGSQLAPDQHYCLVCGERRGAARFSALPAPGAVTTETITETHVGARPPRFGSAAATLIAGVATLLIAMGIGVYIGGLGKNNTPTNGSSVRVVTVNGGSGGPATPTATTGASAAGSGGSKAGNGKHGGSHKVSAAAKVVTTVKNVPPPTVTVGASGSGKGYQNHKFTGHFFGP